MSTVQPAADLRDEARRLATLAWPVVVAQLGTVAFGAEDVLMVGRLGAHDLAVVSAGHLYGFAVLMLGLGVMRGLDPVFSQAHGAGDRAAGAAALGRAVVLAVLVSVPLTAAMLVSGPVLAALGQPGSILADVGRYCDAVAVGVLPAMVLAAVTQFLQGLGEMRVPMITVLIANVANIALDAVAVFGVEVGPVALPPLGAVGCGWATTGSRVVWLVALLWLGGDVLRRYRPPGLATLLQLRPLARLLGLGLPVGLQTGLEVWAFSGIGLLMGALGARELAAHAVALNLVSVTFMVPFGVGAAAATRVGNLVGAGHPWQRAGWTAIAMGVGWMALTSTLFVLFPGPISGLYTADPAVLAVAVTILPVAGAFQLFDGVQAVSFGVLRGAGDVRVPALANVVGYWLVGLPLGWWFGVHTAQDPVRVWGALVVALVIVASLLLVRLAWVGRRGAVVVRA
jgi:MATE family multidrug resistance protein